MTTEDKLRRMVMPLKRTRTVRTKEKQSHGIPMDPILPWGRGEKKILPVGGVVKSGKINVTLAYGVLRGGVKIKGGLKLSIIYRTGDIR
jgi:hypothetical protein